MQCYSNANQRIIDTLSAEQQEIYRLGKTVNIFEGVFLALQPVSIGLFLYHAHNDTVTKVILAWVLGLATATFLLRFLFAFPAGKKMFFLGYDCALAMRRTILAKLIQLPISALQKIHVGKVSLLLSEEMTFLEMYITFVRGQKFIALANLISLLVLITIVAPLLALFAYAMVAIMYGITCIFRKSINRGLQARNVGIGEANRDVMEYVQGMAVLRAFNATDAQGSRYDQAVNILKQGFIQTVKKNKNIALSIRSLLEVSVSVLALGFAYLWLQNMIDPMHGIAVLIIAVVSFAALDVVILANAIGTMVNITHENITEIENYPTVPWGNKTLAAAAPQVIFDNVSFAYCAGMPVLRGVSFVARAKSMTAIVGPSGAGKTTILNLIARFWDVNSGRIQIGTIPIGELTEESLMAQLSVVSQDVKLFNQNIYDNIGIGRPNASHEAVIAAAKQAQAYNFIMALPNGFETLVGEGGKNLSGGERQRVTIARAILKDSPIILLDEATAAIDPENEAVIQKGLNQLVQNKTVIVVAHKLSTIVGADNIVVLHEGKVDSMGTHEQLLEKSPLYLSLWQHHKNTTGWTL